jgi:hypothetical protein
MTTVILGPPPATVEALIAQRQRLGLDGHDEVWEGERILRATRLDGTPAATQALRVGLSARA